MIDATRIGFDVVSTVALLALLVLGLAVIVGMMGILNLAHGDLVLLGAVVMYGAESAGLSPWAGLLLAPLVLGVVGLVLERSVIRHFYHRPIQGLVVTWALGLAIRETVRFALGGTPKSVASPLNGTVSLGEVSVSQWRVFIIGLAIAVLAATFYLVRRTGLGLKVRATLDNPALARTAGVSTTKMYAGAFAFGSALAGLAGAALVPLQTLLPELGLNFLMRSFLSVMIGGIGSFEASIGGAAVVGSESSLMSQWASPVLADLVLFVAAIVLMRFRPYGLFGSRENG